MASLPQLVQVAITDDPDEQRFFACLTPDGENTLVSIDADSVPALVELTTILKTAKVEYKMRTSTEGVGVVVRLGFNTTGPTEAVKILIDLFGHAYRNLMATYWYNVSGGDTPELAVLVDPAVRGLRFHLVPDDPRNSPELWRRFYLAIYANLMLGWQALTQPEDDHLDTSLSPRAWEAGLEKAILGFVALFSFNDEQPRSSD